MKQSGSRREQELEIIHAVKDLNLRIGQQSGCLTITRMEEVSLYLCHASIQYVLFVLIRYILYILLVETVQNATVLYFLIVSFSYMFYCTLYHSNTKCLIPIVETYLIVHM